MPQKHISPTLGQIQTKAALQNFKDFYASKPKVSFDEKRSQAERERRTVFRTLATGVLRDLGFKVR